MKTKITRIALVSLITVAVIALGANAFAGKGMGRQSDDRGYGHHQRQGGCGYGQMNKNLTTEQREQMEAERQAFFDATKSARQDLYAKRLELRAEMAKRQPDIEKASALQKEVSELQAGLDQKRLNHIMAMRKIDPDAARGWLMEGRCMGKRMGYAEGHAMGYGPGNCRR
jgi:Spy/CpxP family protein refolding chaperone